MSKTQPRMIYELWSLKIWIPGEIDFELLYIGKELKAVMERCLLPIILLINVESKSIYT